MNERLLELLVDRACGELSPQDAQELDSLMAGTPADNIESIERAAAALSVAFCSSVAVEPMPESLQHRLHAAAGDFIARTSRTSGSSKPPIVEVESAPLRFTPETQPSRRTLSNWAGWAAAAACLLLAVWAWVPRKQAGPSSPIVDRLNLLNTAPDVATVAWTATEDPLNSPGAGGDVVWSQDRQSGYMRISGLASNDPSKLQYQLWIFDKNRSDKYPVDGGVFDIPAGKSEAVIPIDAKLPVSEAVLFAVTVEPPGGSVVSDRRIVLVAKPG